MKKVIILQAIVITVLMGCSFSKNQPETEIPKVDSQQLDKIKNLEDAIKILPTVELDKYLKSAPPKPLNKPFEDGKTPIEVALERGNQEILKLLLDAGASPFIKNSKTNQSPYEKLRTAKISAEESKAYHYSGGGYSLAAQVSAFKAKHDLLLKDLLQKGIFPQYLDEIEEKQIPCEIPIEHLIDARRLKNSIHIPENVIKKTLNSQACQQPLNLKNLVSLYTHEFETQVAQGFGNLSIMEFLSSKNPNTLFYIEFIDTYNRTYFINTAAIVSWLTRGKKSLSPLIERMQQLSHFPNRSAILVNYNNSSTPSPDSLSYSLDEVQNIQDRDLSAILNEASESYLEDIKVLLEKGSL